MKPLIDKNTMYLGLTAEMRPIAEKIEALISLKNDCTHFFSKNRLFLSDFLDNPQDPQNGNRWDKINHFFDELDKLEKWSQLPVQEKFNDDNIAAAFATYEWIIKQFAEHHNASNPERSLVFWAIFNKCNLTLEALIKAGAIVNPTNEEKVDPNNFTPLMEAARFGNLQAVNLLLEQGAKPEAQTSNGYTALMLAARKDVPSCRSGFLDNEGRDMRHIVLALVRATAGLSFANQALNLTNEEGNTALILATSCYENLPAVKMLIEHRADVDHQNHAGMSALMIASAKGYINTVKALLVAGATVGLRNGNGNNAEQWAQHNGHHAIASILIDAKNEQWARKEAARFAADPITVSSISVKF